MKNIITHPLSIIAILLSIIFLLLSNADFKKICCSAEYRTFNSPDSAYYIKLNKYASFLSIMPGSTGDAPGYIQLYNNQHQLLQQQEVEMVQLVEEVKWQPGQVSIKFIADWNLPE